MASKGVRPISANAIEVRASLAKAVWKGRVSRQTGQSRFKVTMKAAFSFEGGDG